MNVPLAPRSDFLGIDQMTHLYTAAECPMLRAGRAALEEYAVQKSRAEAGRAHHAEVANNCRDAIAQLLGASSDDIAFLSSASEGINAVCGLIDFQPGDNVVVNDLEFPSVSLPWLRLKARGIDVRVVRHDHWDISTAALLSAVDHRTRLLGLSQVSYVNGLRHDVEMIGAALRGTGTLFLVDATQSLGVLPVPASSADFVVSSTYKWLLGTHGLGILYWNRSRQPDVQPAEIGWYSVADTFAPDRFEHYTLKANAGRFETGYVNFPGIYVLARSVPYLQAVGIGRIAEHAWQLGDTLIAGLDELGVETMSPTTHDRRGASISFTHTRANELGRELVEKSVHVWAGDGRVRASTHLFNGENDIDRYLGVLSSILRHL